MGYIENLNWLWNKIYLQGVSGWSLCTWVLACISGTIPPINECPSWNAMVNIVNYCTFNYGACTFFWQIYTFCINVHDWEYISCSTNKKLVKPGRWTNYATQSGNWHETFSIKLTCFIMSICFTKVNCTCWHKGSKHESSITKGFSMYLCWNSTTLERVPHLRT